MGKQKVLVLKLIMLFLPILVFGQKSDGWIVFLNNYIDKQQNTKDYSEYVVTNQNTSRKSGISHTYINQKYSGIEIENSVLSLHINRKNEVVKIHDQFEKNIASRIVTDIPTLNLFEVFQLVCSQSGYPNPINIVLVSESNEKDEKTIFKAKNIANDDIIARLKYQPIESGEIILCWEFIIDEISGQNYWSIRADASSGEILDKKNWAVNCNFHSEIPIQKSTKKDLSKQEKTPIYAFTPLYQYNVYPLGIESPNHGDRNLLIQPSDPIASPYGWHDTDGEPGFEFTTTKGNNAEAREDKDGNNNTLGEMAEGDEDLDFDFPILPNVHPEVNQNAAITNLFYWNNIIHDIFYHYGFDEESGNFQENNYGNGGLENDYVRAEALDGGGTNNANFSTPVDGSRPRMQMFLWNINSTGIVNSPQNIQGNYTILGASFGNSNYTITNDIVLVNDGSDNPTLGCNPLVNGDELNGKIAMIDRGICEFGTKCLNAQNAGAIAVIVCNNTGGALISMGSGADGDDVIIPCVMMSQANCNTIKLQLSNGVNFTMSGGQLDGDYDNGIITHEYGHGISIRLTGGGGNSSCLSNVEQMGEGWSDWFGLMLTMDEEDLENQGRGIGTYALNQPITGNGIRAFRYSTDMAVNPHTYNSIITASVPHGVGSVWCAMLWELTWALIREYGYDPDLYYGNGGNNMALALVTEGLKLQPCAPGFVDGRDAILAADQALYGGAHQCLIWKSFAKRGLGFSASQGSTASRTDGTQAFDMPEDCCTWVSNTLNAGNGSLREAVACAENMDTIRFLNFIHGQDIDLTSETISLNKDLTLFHPFENQINVRANGNFPVFDVLREVKIENLILKTGNTSEVRAIRNEGTLTLKNTTVIDTGLDNISGITILNLDTLFIDGNSQIIRE